MQLSGLPSQDTPLSVGECGIYWGRVGEGCALCASESRAKGAPGKRWLGQGWGSWSLQLFGEDEGGGQTQQGALWE